MQQLTSIELHELELVVNELRGAKEAEEAARLNRIEKEKEIVALFPALRDSAQKTIKLHDGRRVTVKTGISYKANIESIAKIMKDLFPDMPSPQKVSNKVVFDTLGYEWYRLNRPDIFKEISQYVEVKPKKVSVSVKLFKE